MTPPGVRQTVVGALRRQSRPLVKLAAWSALEALPALLAGALTALAVDDGFLAGRPRAGVAWLVLLGAVTVLGAVGTRHAYHCLGQIVEPFRDELARLVVSGAVYGSTGTGTRPDTAAVARLTHQVELVRDTYGGLIMVVRAFLFTAVAALVGLFSLAPVIAGLVAVPLLAGLGLFAAALPAMVARQREYIQADDQLGEMAGAVLAGHRDVLACGAAASAALMVDRPITAQATAERALARMAALRSLTLAVSGWLPLGVLLALAPWLVHRGLTAGEILGALVYLCAALQPALHALVVGIAGGGLRFAVTLERILQAAGSHTMSGPARTCPGAAPAIPGPSRSPVVFGTGHRCAGAVGLHGVTFRYGPAARPVLHDFDLVLTAGDHLAVVGPSGTGKSTLVALMAGMLAPQSGMVCLDGRPIAALDPAALAELRVLVPQEAYVFSGTLGENLRYLRPSVSAADLEAAVDLLGLRPLANRLGGLRASVDPALLSAGERQLIAAVRAYLSPAPLVILDEATCHLDPTTEATVEAAFAARPGTLVVVAHRIRSAARAQWVLMLDDECTVLGRHDNLLVNTPAYRALFGHHLDRV